MAQLPYICIGVYIMENVNYNLRIDKALRDKSFAVIESFGLSSAQAIRLFLKQTAETDGVPPYLLTIAAMENDEYTEHTPVNALLDSAQN